jgi:hypothetical protein
MALLEEHGLLEATGNDAREQEPPFAFPKDELAGYVERLQAEVDLLARLQAERGWKPQTLRTLGVGFDGERLTLPSRDEEGRLVGLARYMPWRREDEPKLLSLAGSRRQLFPAPESVPEGEGYLFLLEGEPDAISAHALGLAAVALPGARSWQREWRERFRGRTLCLVFDCDQPGRQAAVQVAGDLVEVVQELRILELDRARTDGFDLSDRIRELRSDGLSDAQIRDWLQLQASRATLLEPERGDHLLDEVVGFLRRYVVIGEAELDSLALWVLHTHAFSAAEATPYLAISSAEKACGKTRLLETLELLVSKPWLTGRVTPAVLTRKVDAEEPTLLLDESDAAFGGEKEYAEVRGRLEALPATRVVLGGGGRGGQG